MADCAVNAVSVQTGVKELKTSLARCLRGLYAAGIAEIEGRAGSLNLRCFGLAEAVSCLTETLVLFSAKLAGRTWVSLLPWCYGKEVVAKWWLFASISETHQPLTKPSDLTV